MFWSICRWAYEINVIMAGTLPNAEVAVAVLGICLAISGGCINPGRGCRDTWPGATNV